MSELVLDGLHERHPGLTPALGQSYAEAACVCFSRHHQPPVVLALNQGSTVEHHAIGFTLPDIRIKNAHANELDATEAGAYLRILGLAGNSLRIGGGP